MSRKIVHIPQHKEVASTPSTPDSGYSKIYVKSDGLWYYLNDAGDETQLGAGGGTWGSITGTLSEQTDLQEELDLKVDASRLINTAADSGLSGGDDLTGDVSLKLSIDTLAVISDVVTPEDSMAVYNSSAGSTERTLIANAVTATQAHALTIQPFSRTTSISVIAESEEGVTCPFNAKITKVIYTAWAPGSKGTTDIRLLVDGAGVNSTGGSLDANGKAVVLPPGGHGVGENSIITVEVLSIQTTPAPIGLTVTIVLTRT